MYDIEYINKRVEALRNLKKELLNKQGVDAIWRRTCQRLEYWERELEEKELQLADEYLDNMLDIL